MTDYDGQDIWMWPISEDESKRLTAMLGQDFHDLNIAGTYVNTPITQCPMCGKDNELVDWCVCLSVCSTSQTLKSVLLGSIQLSRRDSTHLNSSTLRSETGNFPRRANMTFIAQNAGH